VNSSTLTEAAFGVAAYLDQQQAVPQALTPHHSCALVSHALSAAGDDVLARRLRIFGSSLVYPASWVVTGDQTVWILDVGRLLAPHDPRMEMALFDRFQSALNAFADVWDGTQGRGVLGLKGLSAAARFVLGHAAPNARIKRLAMELHRLGGRHLEMVRHQRRWEYTPTVMSLDL
jgi:hypothetical protein